MITEPPFTLAYIVGTGHCGSTLLSLLLNAHSKMLGMSSLRKIDFLIRPTGNQDLGGDTRILEAEFWQRVRARYEQTSGRAFDQLSIHHPSWKVFRHWSREEIVEWARPAHHLMSSIAAESGRTVLADSSKAWQQLYLLKRSGLFRIKVLHALRDGRAVFHSYDRKYQNFGFSFGQWAKPTIAVAAMRPFFETAEWHTVRYEDLASNPEATLSEICRFLGTEFEPAMLQYRRPEWVGILGNRMLKRSDETIQLDERWKTDLAKPRRLLFELVGGHLNRYFGYAYRA